MGCVCPSLSVSPGARSNSLRPGTVAQNGITRHGAPFCVTVELTQCFCTFKKIWGDLGRFICLLQPAVCPLRMRHCVDPVRRLRRHDRGSRWNDGPDDASYQCGGTRWYSYRQLHWTTEDYLFNSPSGYDSFVLKVTGATVDGNAVHIPGLNSEYGLYIEGTVAVSSTNTYGPGTIALLLDPTNNDGSLAAAFNSTTQTGGVSFSNQSGTHDDVTIASGQFVSGSVWHPEQRLRIPTDASRVFRRKAACD